MLGGVIEASKTLLIGWLLLSVIVGSKAMDVGVGLILADLVNTFFFSTLFS